MPAKFFELTVSPSVREAQTHYYKEALGRSVAPMQDALGPDEIQFIEARDSFYLASVGENGWPYIQHRGGAPGFVRCLEPNVLGFADYKGNRQLLSTGNLATNSRVALFLMDYRRRSRLKILGHATIHDARDQPELLARLAAPAIRGKVERLFVIKVTAFDWNCPQYITPRYTAAEIEEAVAPLKTRISELEAQLKAKSSP